MSDTPETDAAIKEQSEWKLPFVSTTMDGVTYDGAVASLCRRMERERDEWEETARLYCQNSDYHREMREKAERERDEARDKLADWEDSAKHVRSEWPDEQHCSCVPILRKLLKDAERERDEAKEKYDILATEHMLAINKLCNERDEARAERDKYWASIIQIDEITKNAGMKEDAK
jgi:hypothetical protein